MRSSALSVLAYGGLQVPPHGGAGVRDYTRQTRTPARGRQPAGAATSACAKACVATDKAPREMVSQTGMRSNAKKRDADLALQTAATADAHEAVAALQMAGARDRATNLALEKQMQVMKRQKTAGDYALLATNQNASSLQTAHVLALQSREMSVGLDAAAAALKARTAWEETVALRADAQHSLLLASREETALAI